MSAPVVYWVLDVLSNCFVNPYEEERTRLDALSRQHAPREAWRRDLSRRGFVVTARGVVAYEAGDGGLLRREYLTSSFRSVEVRDEDEAHVSVSVDTILGRVEMPWLPRSRDVLDVVSGWPSSSVRLEGAQ